MDTAASKQLCKGTYKLQPPLIDILYAYFMNPPPDGAHGKSTWRSIERWGTQPLVQKSSIRWCSFSYLLNLILSYLKMALMYKKLPMGGLVYMSLYEMFLRWLNPQFGPFEGGLAAALPCFGPKSHSLHSCNLRAQNRLGLQLNLLQIAHVMDTAASKLLFTGTYKLHPPLTDISVSSNLVPMYFLDRYFDRDFGLFPLHH